jgi:uncharacterized protein YndB with AHSA1/START domain
MDARVRNSTDAERELIIRRSFDAPRELVFRAWTEPQLLAQWSCPRGFTFAENRGELRVGGAFSARMRSPEGTEHRLRGVYREIVPPERLVFTHCWVDEHGTAGPETLVTVTLTEGDGRTEMMFHQGLFASVGARDGHQQGWTSCFERLAELLRGAPRVAAA